MNLHKYQQKGVDLTVKYGSLYHMLDAGLGKTALSLRAIEKVGVPAFVLGPKLAITHTWPEEIKKWTPGLSYQVLHGKNKAWRAKQECDVTLLNYEGLKWFFKICAEGKFKLKKFFMVFDEAAMIKYNGWETKTGQLTRYGRLRKMSPIFSDYKIALSAVPAPNTLLELWAQYYMLDKGERLGKSYYHFRDKYFYGTGYQGRKFVLREGAEEKIYDAIKDMTYQLNAEDHLNMPSLTQNIISLPMSKSLRKMYDELDTEYIVEVEGETVISNSEATNYHKLRQLLQGGVYSTNGATIYLKDKAKIEYLKEFVKTAAGNPILAAIQFRFEYEQICKEFNYEVPVIYGKQSAKQSSRYIRQWNKGKLPLLLVHPGSVKYSLNLQAGGHCLIWLAMPWSYDDYYQLLRRLYRQGQRRGVISHSVVFTNSIDEKVAKALRLKARTDSRLKAAMGEQGL